MTELDKFYCELKVLKGNAEDDYGNKNYYAYEYFLKTYNGILNQIKSNNMYTELEEISLVPDGEKGSYGIIGSQSEMAKHREVIHRCKDLMSKIEMEIAPTKNNINTSKYLENIFFKFHRVVRQLRSRYDGRDTLEIEDEYDVQDLLHAVLRIHFDDIRPEEWTPSYAGGSKRMDFLLKNEKTVIEVKKTRKGLADKQVGEQLIIDIECYKEHPDCENLVCFVYDPEGRIGNPVGIESDLSKQSKENLDVQVYIYPQ